MDTKFGRRNFWKALMLVIGAISYGLSNATSLASNSPSLGEWKSVGLILAAIFTFGAILWHFIDLQNAIDVYRNTSPNVVAESVELEKPFPIFVGGVETSTIVERYYLVLRNTKAGKSHKLVDTDKVHAKVSFYDKKNYNFLPQYSHELPFWLGSKPPYEIDRTQGYQIVIEASGKPQGLHLVIRKQGSDDLYVFSQKSYDLSRKSLTPFQETLKLTDSKYFVCVQVFTGNFDMEPVWFLLSNHGAGKPPEFERLNKPPREFSASKIATQHRVQADKGGLSPRP